MGVFETVIAQSSRKSNGLGGVLERRAVKRMPTLRANCTGMTSHLWELEMVPAFGLTRLVEDIEALARRSLDHNIFFEASAVKAAWPRLTSVLAPHGMWMLCLWESTGKGRKLRLFMPVSLNKVGFPARLVLQPLANDYMPLGTPLIDRGCAGEAAETLLRLLGDPELKLPGVIDFIWQRQDSKFFAVLENAISNLGLVSENIHAFDRAALVAYPDQASSGEPILNKKRMRELARQLKKLNEIGKTEFECARTETAILNAIEGFVTLEMSGWKGRRGTALYNQKNIAAFSRQIVAGLAASSSCEIHSLKLDGRPIASLIFFGRKGRLVSWKMAFDEKLFAYSPGMQVMVKATQTLLQRKSFIEADSLAAQNHDMMNRVWSDRIPMTNIAVALRPNAYAQLQRVVRSKRRLVQLKSTAKRILSWRPDR
ncbi:MAG: GNAT family N-acetyltransferase [Rhizobiaceae bacterium]